MNAAGSNATAGSNILTDLVPFEPSDDRSYDEQMRDALEKALTIQGTVIADLEAAINCILQMERALSVAGMSQFNPHEATAQYLKTKYKMYARTASESASNSRKLLEAGDGGLEEGDPNQLELVEGEIVE